MLHQIAAITKPKDPRIAALQKGAGGRRGSKQLQHPSVSAARAAEFGMQMQYMQQQQQQQPSMYPINNQLSHPNINYNQGSSFYSQYNGMNDAPAHYEFESNDFEPGMGGGFENMEESFMDSAVDPYGQAHGQNHFL
jgi:hypothetical protein